MSKMDIFLKTPLGKFPWKLLSNVVLIVIWTGKTLNLAMPAAQYQGKRMCRSIAICFKKTDLVCYDFDLVLPPWCLFRVIHSVYRARTASQNACVNSLWRHRVTVWFYLRLYSVRKVGSRRRYFPLVSILSIFLVADNLKRPCVLLCTC